MAFCWWQDAGIVVRDFEAFLASLNDQGYLLKKGPRIFQLQVTDYWVTHVCGSNCWNLESALRPALLILCIFPGERRGNSFLELQNYPSLGNSKMELLFFTSYTKTNSVVKTCILASVMEFAPEFTNFLNLLKFVKKNLWVIANFKNSWNLHSRSGGRSTPHGRGKGREGGPQRGRGKGPQYTPDSQWEFRIKPRTDVICVTASTLHVFSAHDALLTFHLRENCS